MKGGTFLGLLPIGEVCRCCSSARLCFSPLWCYYAEFVESLRAGLGKVVVVLGVMQRQAPWFRQCSTLRVSAVALLGQGC